MKAIQRTSGVSFIVPDDIDVATPAPRAAQRRARAVAAPAALPEHERIVAALAGADFEIVDRVALRRRSAAQRITRAATRERPLRVEVPVARSQRAVLLVEQNGMYAFALPAVKPRAARRDVVAFELGFAPPKRGVVRGTPFGEVRTYILRFAADRVIKTGVKYLERNVQRGFVDMRPRDPLQWRLLASLNEMSFPRDRAPRILLFVHGTFSSTLGGFAALCGSPWGNALLEAARTHYDAIVGFDHPTLSVDPRVNARALLAGLEKRTWTSPPVIDIVTHSRGGLVVRTLVERLLPRSKIKADIGKIVMVACTNEGTLLAEPVNWKHFVDMYVNLIAAGCRVVELFGHGKVAAMVIEEVVKALGSFLKLLAVSAVTDKRAPGIAAMAPDGAFVASINKTRPGQRASNASQYYVVQSDFATTLLGKDGPDEFSRRFSLWLADGFIDKLMKQAANDLVVDVSSMAAIDVPVGRVVNGTYDFGTNAQVYHTNYFTRPETTQAIGEWLGVLPPPVRKIVRTLRSARKPTKKIVKKFPTTRDLALRIKRAR